MENKEKNQKKPTKKGIEGIKRSGIVKGFSIISLFIMVPVFFLTALFLVILPRSEVSNIEKRNLAEFPEFSFDALFSGQYTEELGNYYDDTVPYRDELKTVGYNFKSLFGIHTDDEIKVVGKPIEVVNKDGEKKNPDEESKPSDETSKQSSEADSSQSSQPTQTGTDESSVQESSEQEPEYTVENGIIVVKQNGHYRALELFGGGTGNAYVKALNNFNKDFGGKVKIYSMIAPLASEYYTPAGYEGYTASQKECFDSIASRLDEGIVSVDIDTVLGEHKDEDIYFRTDHHWSPLGAYYAAQTFAKAAGVDFKDLSTYKKNDIEGFVGTMYSFTQDANINNDPETFSYYTPDNIDHCTAYYYDTSFNYTGSGNFFNKVGDPTHNAYLTFMGGDEQIVKVKTNIKNGKKLLIVKDSYGNAVPGYLFGAYEEIYVVDMRYFDLNLVDFVNQNKVTDMLFAMVTYSAVGENADNLEILRTQNKGAKITDGAPD
ncbi:MAG: hypothetical protein IJ861_03240 [Clostridia bacterium]|nr:hypothetical protein [Clostridia bacterium]